MILSNKTNYTGQEGSARNSNKDYVRFLYISFGSLTELETQIIISYELGFIDKNKSDYYQKELARIGKMIQGLIKYLVKKDDKSPVTSYQSPVTAAKLPQSPAIKIIDKTIGLEKFIL